MDIVSQSDTDVKNTITLIVEYEGSGPHILRNAGTIVEVHRNGDPGRPPKDPNLDAAIRWLADNGYEPVSFQNLDRPGVTTFRPRREQVYQKMTA